MTAAVEVQGLVRRYGRLEAVRGISFSIPRGQVLGFIGPNGAGKTSTIRMIVAGLNPDQWGVTWINPWALSGPDAVVTELLGAIRAAVPEKTTAGARVRLRNWERRIRDEHRGL